MSDAVKWLCNYSYTCRHCVRQWKSVCHGNRINIFTDIFVGIVTCVVLKNSFSNATVKQLFLASRTQTKVNIETLLHWLMGNPAGLKLNHELTYCMGHFFLYHVEVWMQYLKFIEFYFFGLITCLVYSNCFGLTLFLSLVMDLINVLTLHFYCFYAYTARLYSLQLRALKCLARLFMGKKIKSERLRAYVDSLTYEAEQLILGTILFTILLFVLPTTVVFYLVFSSARLVVLAAQFLLSIVVTFIIEYDFLAESSHTNVPARGIFAWSDVFVFFGDLISGTIVKIQSSNDR